MGGPLGRPLPRFEDWRLVTGRGCYVDDLHPEGALYAAFVRSYHAHARIASIRAERARALPGVVAVWTAADLPPGLSHLPPPRAADLRLPPHPVLARDRVAYVGQPVAVVVAESRAAAADAAEAVEVDYDPLPVVVDPWEALEDRVPVHPDLGTNRVLERVRDTGDAEAAFARAACVVAQEFRIPRLVGVPIEPRCGLATWDPAGQRLTYWASAQSAHRVREDLARLLGLPLERVRVVVPDVGGAFGVKRTGPEDVLAALAALRLGRPVKWVETRSEHMVAAHQGRGQVARLELAADADGRILALRGTIVADLGAYAYALTPIPAGHTLDMMCGPYRIPSVALRLVGVATHKTPAGPYRGAGRPEATLYLERLVDLLARRLGLDPAEVRRRNLIPRDAFPHRTATGITYDSGDYAAALERALALIDYEGIRRRQRRAGGGGIPADAPAAASALAAAPPARRLLGVGLALYVEKGGGGEPWEYARVHLRPDGRVAVMAGATSQGQGHATVLAQVAAAALGVDPAEVDVVEGDTEQVEEGVGTFASRSMAMAGSAVWLAAQELRRRVLTGAAELLRCPPNEADRLELQQGRVRCPATGRELALAELAAALAQRGVELVARARFRMDGLTYPAGAHAAVVEVDLETGQVAVRRLVCVDDCGTVVNPLLAEGQVVGAAIQGVGQALYEVADHDPSGQPLAANLAAYAVPTAAEAPPVESEFAPVPSPLNPLGVKGAGEGGSIGVPAAVVNAVVDALAPLGIEHLDLPLHPSRVWQAIQAALRSRG